MLANFGVQVRQRASAKLLKLFHYLWNIPLISSKHVNQVRIYGHNGPDGACRLERMAGLDRRGGDEVIISWRGAENNGGGSKGREAVQDNASHVKYSWAASPRTLHRGTVGIGRGARRVEVSCHVAAAL